MNLHLASTSSSSPWICRYSVVILSILFLFLLNSSVHATIYSDAESGTVGWTVFDAQPSGATISAVRDNVRNSQVIQTQGAGRSNSYLLGGTDSSSGWNNSTELRLKWDMAVSESYNIQVYVETSFGTRRLIYSGSNSDGLRNPGNNSISFGLGSTSKDGQWRSFERDLAADISTGEPGNSLVSVNGFLVLGSMRLDNIELEGDSDTPPPPSNNQRTVYSDAENGNDGWTVFDATPAGARISVVNEASQNSNVIQTQGDGRSNSYLLGGITNSTGWNNDAEFELEWQMSSNEPYVVTLYVETTAGTRRLSYTQSNSNGLKNPSPNNNSISFGLGSSTTDGSWRTFNRDLAADIAIGEPGNSLLNVNGMLILGSVKIDNVSLSTDGTVVVPDPDPDPDPEINDEAAARLLAQASFGATLADINAVRTLGVSAWINDQFSKQGSSHLAYSQRYLRTNGRPASKSFTGPRQQKWLINAIDGEDQLRQRVTFALSEIFVTSDVGQVLKREQHAMSNYYDLLSDNAFGNYRELLEAVTLNPVMGLYLSMLQNTKANSANNTRADENYAREIMQLFSIGLHQLNNDGTTTTNPPTPAYTQGNVEEYARVFTGWSYAGNTNWNISAAVSSTNKIDPMQPFPEFHDVGEKTLLNGVISPAGLSAEDDLSIALDSLFNHPNVGPFIGKQLIQRLVTSNPSPEYVGRVATAFNDNGLGIRGDMKAMIRAILLDPEARTGHQNIANFGKLREPLLRMTHLWRAFNVQRGDLSTNNTYNTGSPRIWSANSFFGQSVLSASSVFNFFHPDYSPQGPLRDTQILAPEAEIYSDSRILTSTAYLTRMIQLQYQGGNQNTRNTSYLDITAETTLASNPNALLDRLDLLLLSGQMSSGLREILLEHMSTLNNDENGRSQQVRDCISLIMASPEYLVQK